MCSVACYTLLNSTHECTIVRGASLSWGVLSMCVRHEIFWVIVCCVSSCCCQCWWTSLVIRATKLPPTLLICSLDSVNSQPSDPFPLTVINCLFLCDTCNIWWAQNECMWTAMSEFVSWMNNFYSLAVWILPEQWVSCDRCHMCVCRGVFRAIIRCVWSSAGITAI